MVVGDGRQRALTELEGLGVIHSCGEPDPESAATEVEPNSLRLNLSLLGKKYPRAPEAVP